MTGEDFLDAQLVLKQMVKNPDCPIPEHKGRVLVIDHFDYNLWDYQYNDARLKLLEHLVYEVRCPLVVVSTVDPLYFLTVGASDVLTKPKEPDHILVRQLVERWARVLSKFKRVRPSETGEKEFFKRFISFVKLPDDQSDKLAPEQLRHRGEFAIWVCEECNCTAMLRWFGIEIFDEYRDEDQNTREGLVNKVLDRASSYYHLLWAALTFDERLVLYQLALDAWTNPKNGAAIQQLERKQLIYKAPMYRIMNESFRRFIKSTEHQNEMLKWQKRERESTWHAFRNVLIAVAIAVVAWMLYAQATLSQTMIGLIAGSASLIAAIGGLLAHFGKGGGKVPSVK